MKYKIYKNKEKAIIVVRYTKWNKCNQQVERIKWQEVLKYMREKMG